LLKSECGLVPIDRAQKEAPRTWGDYSAWFTQISVHCKLHPPSPVWSTVISPNALLLEDVFTWVLLATHARRKSLAIWKGLPTLEGKCFSSRSEWRSSSDDS